MRHAWALAVILVAPARAADEDVRLAPTIAEWRAALGEVEGALAVADAAGEATARVQNAWVEAGASSACDLPVLQAAARSAAFGDAWRDAAQAARDRFAAVGPMREAPTVAPLLGPADRGRADAVAARVERHERALIEARAWHLAHLAPIGRRCGAALAGSPGLRRAEILAKGEALPPSVAIGWAGPGVLCVDGAAAPGAPQVVVLPATARACVAEDAACACVAEALYPAAVLAQGVSAAP